MYKRLLILILVIVFCFMIIGCDDSKENNNEIQKETNTVTSETVSDETSDNESKIVDYSAANNYGYDSWQIGRDPYGANPLDAAGNTRKCAKCNAKDISIISGYYAFDYCDMCKCDEMTCNKPYTVGWSHAYCDTHANQYLCIKCFKYERENGSIYCRHCAED